MNEIIKSSLKIMLIVAVIIGLYLLVSPSDAFAAAETTETDQEYMPTEAEIDMLAKTLYREARGESKAVRLAVIWHILNRVDDPRWGNTIKKVVTQPHQMANRKKTPIVPELREECKAIVNVWIWEKQGFITHRILPPEYVFMSDSTGRMRFRTAYKVKDADIMYVD